MMVDSCVYKFIYMQHNEWEMTVFVWPQSERDNDLDVSPRHLLDQLDHILLINLNFFLSLSVQQNMINNLTGSQ